MVYEIYRKKSRTFSGRKKTESKTVHIYMLLFFCVSQLKFSSFCCEYLQQSFTTMVDAFGGSELEAHQAMRKLNQAPRRESIRWGLCVFWAWETKGHGRQQKPASCFHTLLAAPFFPTFYFSSSLLLPCLFFLSPQAPIDSLSTEICSLLI